MCDWHQRQGASRVRLHLLSRTLTHPKTTIFKQAIELGAQPLHNLTDKVTHLLALEPGSPKYKVRRVPLCPPCVSAHPLLVCFGKKTAHHAPRLDHRQPQHLAPRRRREPRRGEYHPQALHSHLASPCAIQSVEAHRLPIFSDVVLCISGIDDVTQRTDINRLVTDGGGNYVKNIERPVRVTHLLCSTSLDDMSEKMLYATKFNQRKEASIRLVWEQWFWDCLKMGGMYCRPAELLAGVLTDLAYRAVRRRFV